MQPELTPFKNIRENVFREKMALTFAEAIDISPAQLSRLEAGHNELTMPVMRRVRALAAERGVRWSDRLFFEVLSPADLETLAEPLAAVACERQPVLQAGEGAR